MANLGAPPEATDLLYVLRTVLGHEARLLPPSHPDGQSLDCLVAIGHESPGPSQVELRQAIADFARDGGLVLGIGDGFGVLCELGLLPGALAACSPPGFLCRSVSLRVESVANPFTRLAVRGDVWHLPLRGARLRYTADEATLDRLDRDGLVLLRYVPSATKHYNPTGSSHDVAGITEATRKVFGLAAHPQHAADASLLEAEPHVRAAGKLLFQSVATWMEEGAPGGSAESMR